MTQSNLKQLPKISTKRFFVAVVTEYQTTQYFDLEASTLPKARKEALEYLADVRVDQGWVELYERGAEPSASALLVWVGLV